MKPVPYQVQIDTIYTWDALELLATMRACGLQVNCIVTSPPYFGLRNYGVEGQIGQEQTPEAYVAALVEVFRAARDVLTDDGALWLNLGDSYANDDKWGGSTGGKHVSGLHGNTGIGRQRKHTGLKPKDMIGIPWRVAFALQADGWYLRSDIIWHKPNVLPESVTDRPTKSHEYLFLLSKSPRYYYDADAIKEPVKEVSVKRISQRTFNSQTGGEKDYQRTNVNTNRSMRKTLENFAKKQDALGKRTYDGFNERYFGGEPGLQRNRRTVWEIATKPFPGAHFATFPEDLIEPAIKAGCPKGGIVLDMFMGSGTVATVAHRLGRHYVGSELNPEYAELARMRVAGRMAEYLARQKGETHTTYMFPEVSDA